MSRKELLSKKEMFERKCALHNQKMQSNPFSDNFRQKPVRLSKENPNYGKPVAGSKSEIRALQAAARINSEVRVLCDMIYDEGEKYPDGTAAIRFEDLFQVMRSTGGDTFEDLFQVMRSTGGDTFEDLFQVMRSTGGDTFEDLFQIYTRISSKVVGILLRARKHGLVTFEGEVLFQGQDNDEPIFLLKPIQEIRHELAQDTEFEVGVCHRAVPSAKDKST